MVGPRDPFKIAAALAPRPPATHFVVMARTFRSLVPKRGRGDSTAPRTPGKPVPPERLDAAAQQKAVEREQAQAAETEDGKSSPSGAAKEVGGPEGPEPTRYGDWERGGICYDF
jgi:hypothetical protein